MEKQADPPLIVIDGLDEAGEAKFSIATDLLAPLARHARVLVASREVEGEEESLLVSLGEAALRIDLGDADDAQDVHDYVAARLEGVHAQMDPEVVGTAIVERLADAEDGPFLLARILTSQLIAKPADTSESAWVERLSTSVEEAFRQDLATGRLLTRDRESLPDAAGELLAALAYSYGAGFPAEDVWPAVATALSPSGTTYGRSDALWALGEYGRYVTTSSVGGQAVYRLHQRLADTLRVEDKGAAAGLAAIATYKEHLERGLAAAAHPYLWVYASMHAVDGQDRGIEALKALARRDQTLRPGVGHALRRFSHRLAGAGRHTLAVGPAEEAVAILEQVSNEDTAFVADLADALNNLGIRYRDVGRHANAIVPGERAVEIYEELAAENPGVLNDLAGALNSLGSHYSALGRDADAIAHSERAVQIHQALAAKNPAVLSDLASSLNNLGIHYGTLGRHADAIAPSERAVQIHQALAAQNPGILSNLASSLGNLGIRYGKVGRHADAVAPTERAVEIYEPLAADNPGLLNELAMALSNLGIRYSNIGRHADAVAPTERATEIYKQLATENPGFLSHLATALNNLGNRYGYVGRHADAIDLAERATEIVDKLATENAGLLHALASSLSNLGVRYSRVGRHADAIPPTERAVEIYNQLATENAGYLNDLASALNNLANHYSGVGRPAHAIAPTERAAEIYNQLATENPGYLNDLASALNNLANHYSGVGRPAQAIIPTERAVEIREQLAAENPGFLDSLAGSLSNLGRHYSDVGRTGDAVVPTERAVAIYGQLATENPGFLSHLATALNNLGDRYSDVGRHIDAIAPTERAVELYSQLTAENPGILTDLANALGNLGTRYSMVERGADAVVPAERAVQIYEQLVDANPGFLSQLATALANLKARYQDIDDDTSQRVWDAAFKRFESNPHAGAALRVRRAEAGDATDAVNDLIDALNLDPGTDSVLTSSIHAGLRDARRDAPDSFAASWSGPLPVWLTLGDEDFSLCEEWLNAPTWSESREVFVANASELLSPLGEAALAELELRYPGEATIAHHRHLLESCRRDGVDVAYRQLLLNEALRDWHSIADRAASQRFLEQEKERLCTTEAAEALAKAGDMEGATVLILAMERGVDYAYDAADDPVGALVEARRTASPAVLHGVAMLAFESAPASAQLHAAIALVLAEGSEAALASLPEDVDVAPLIVDLTDAITHRPEHAAELAALIRALSER